MLKTITSISMLKVPEGQRISYTYSVVDEITGNIIKNNERESFTLLDQNIKLKYDEIELFIKNRDKVLNL